MIKLEATPGFLHPGVELVIRPLAEVSLVRTVPVPGSVTIIEGGTDEVGFRFPADLSAPDFPSLPLEANDLDRALAELRVGETSHPIRVNGLPVTTEDSLPITASSSHELVIEFGPWSWPQLQLTDRSIPPHRCYLNLQFRRLGTTGRDDWRGLEDSSFHVDWGAHSNEARPFEREVTLPLPLLPRGRYAFSMPCALPGVAYSWEAELESGFQVLEPPVPDTLIEIENPQKLGQGDWEGFGMEILVLPEEQFLDELRKGIQRIASPRDFIRGGTHAFLPTGRYRVLVRHTSSYRWATGQFTLQEGKPYRLSPLWQESGAATIHFSNWRRIGRYGWMRLLHLDSGWFTVRRTVAVDPTRATFYGLPPGRYQAVWGPNGEPEAIGFSAPFTVTAKRTTEVSFWTTPDGGGDLEALN